MLKSLWGKSRPSPATKRQHSTEIQLDDFNVIWRQSARRTRSLALKLDKQGRIIVMTPLRTSKHDMHQFVQSKQQWIHQQLDQHHRLEQDKAQAQGKIVWWQGESLQIQHQIGPVNNIERIPSALQITTRQALSQQKIDQSAKKWLREQAQVFLPERLAVISNQAQLQASGIKIKAYTARWGSCRHDGFVQLNWKLMMTPPAVIDYVIVHELSHLKYFNHSAQFWAQVASICADYKQHRTWLKSNGRLLIES